MPLALSKHTRPEDASPPFEAGRKLGVVEMALVWQALQQMWDLDHSAGRGLLSCRGLYVFTHENRLGNAPHTRWSSAALRIRIADPLPARHGPRPLSHLNRHASRLRSVLSLPSVYALCRGD